MELPILLTPLPESAIKLVTQFLWKPHPCAVLIKQLGFRQSDVQVLTQGRTASILIVDTAKWTYYFMYMLQTGEPYYKPSRRAIVPKCG